MSIVGEVCPVCGKGNLLEQEGEFVCDSCGAKGEKGEKKKKHDFALRCDVKDWMWDWSTEKMEKTPEGYLKGRASITNIGVFPYRMADGSIRNELRLPEEVFAPESLATLPMKPLTNDHPSQGVSSDSYKALAVGTLGDNITTDSYRVYAPILIADPKAVRDVEAGKIALSCGYTCDVEIASGVWMGVKYDAIQRNIRYNHVAIVDAGRAGDDAVLRMDSADGYCFSVQKTQETIKMAKYTIDSAEFEVPEVVASHLVALQGKTDKAEADLKLAREDSSRIAADRDTYKEKLDKAEEAIKGLQEKLDKAPAEIEAKIKARADLLKIAQDHAVEVKSDMSDLDIKKAVVLQAFPKADLSDKDEVYISGRFDSALETLQSDKKQDQANKETIKEDASAKKVEKIDSAEAHRRMVASLENAYKA